MFLYNPVYQVVMCHVYKSYIIPGYLSQERHLWAELHRLSGGELKTIVQLLSSYNLRIVEELREHKPRIKG